MKRLIFTLSAVIVIAGCVWVSKPNKAVETKYLPVTVDAPSRIEVHVPENDYPVNVYCDEVPLSDGWQCYTQDKCRRYGVPYSLMLGLMETESSFQTDADSGWAYGICQIGYINEDWLADKGVDIYTTQGNIKAACMILGDYLSRYTTAEALMAYNEGEYGASDSWAEGITETEYSRKVMEAAEKWEAIINDTD